jgi:hypothetical protein
MSGSREDRVRARAHRLWEEEGCPSGREEEHWRRAEAEIAAEEATIPGDAPVPVGPAAAGSDDRR